MLRLSGRKRLDPKFATLTEKLTQTTTQFFMTRERKKKKNFEDDDVLQGREQDSGFVSCL